MKNLNQSILSVNFEHNFSFEPDFVQNLVNIAADSVASSQAGYLCSKKHHEISQKNRNFFRYIWNRMEAYNRKSLLYSRRGDMLSGDKKFASPEVNEDLFFLVRAILEDVKDLQDTEANNFVIDFNFAHSEPKLHMEEYLKLKDARFDLATAWVLDGLKNSKDPSFYEMVWLDTKREEGYVEKQISIIQSCAANVGTIPSAIFNQVFKSTRNSTKCELVQALIGCISKKNQMIRHFKTKELYDQASNAELERANLVRQLTSIITTVEHREKFSALSIIENLHSNELVWVAQKLKLLFHAREMQELERKLTS